MNRLAFLGLFLIQFTLSAHTVSRPVKPVYQFQVHDNQSGIQEHDVWLLLYLLDSLFGSQLGNTVQSSPPHWMKGFNWSQTYLGAGSQVLEGQFNVMLWGGLVRARYMTFGALSSILCHELGHKLGGPPFQKFPDEDPHWSSSEGQSDTFAAETCLPALYEKLKSMNHISIHQEIEPSVVSLCQETSDSKKCHWVATSGIDFIQSIQVYFETSIPFADPLVWTEEKVLETLYSRYPSYQCRMDIFKAKAQNPMSPRLPCWFAK